MKYSSNNLHEPGIVLPLKFPVKLIIDYRPNGKRLDYAPVIMSHDPEGATDEIVRARGWNQLPDFRPSDVWVDAAF